MGLLGLLLGFASAQPSLPPEAIQQFEQVIGDRVEMATILGGDYGAAGGVYTFRGGTLADLSLAKIGGGGMVASPKSLGVGDFKWAPVLQGNLGDASIENEFTTGYLQGNRSAYDILAVQAGGGVRIFVSEELSLATTLSGIYGRTENEFKPQNAIGDEVKAAASGTYVDWEVETWSVVPSLDLRYERRWGRTTFEFTSRYNFFHTASFNSSSPVVNVDGNSQTWDNKIDVDVPLGWNWFGGEFHAGGFFARTELFGGIADGFNEDHFYTVNGRFVLDVLGKVPITRWIGLGYSYFWSDHFGGWSAGLDLRLHF